MRPFIPSPSPPHSWLPESPRVFSQGEQLLIALVYIQLGEHSENGAIAVYSLADRQMKLYPQDKRPGFIIPTTRPNVLFVGMEKKLGLLDLNDGSWQILASIDDDSPRTIINDGEAVPGGKAVVFGTKDLLFQDRLASLYLFTLDDLKITVLADNILCSNGKVFTEEDGKLLLYDIDTGNKQIRCAELSIEERKLGPMTTTVDFTSDTASPDGMVAIDDEQVVVAMYDPDAIEKGRLLLCNLKTGDFRAAWHTPGSPQVTCPLVFEREGVSYLLATTATEHMNEERLAQCPYAGQIFITELNCSSVKVAEKVVLDDAQIGALGRS